MSAPIAKPQIKPLGHYILVRFKQVTEEIRGGLVIPESAREKPQEATIVALGSGRKAKDGTVVSFEVKVGDTVLVTKYSGAEVRLDETSYTLVREEDILGILS
jgi:chaperonin GroES